MRNFDEMPNERQALSVPGRDEDGEGAGVEGFDRRRRLTERGFRIGEISCPTKYFKEASSINFRGSVRYGLGVLATTTEFALQKLGLAHFGIFNPSGRKLPIAYYAAAAGQPGRERAAESTAFKVGNDE